MKLGTVSVSVEAGGRVVIDSGNASYDVDTFYSYPGAPVTASTANQLSSGAGGSEAVWSPKITQVAPTTLEVAAKGASYSLLRRIQLLANERGFQIEFEDQLTNLRSKPTGIVVHYAIVAPQPFETGSFTPEGGAENPTIYLDAGKETLGVLVQDDVSRVRWKACIKKNEADFQIGFDATSATISCIALDAGKSYSIRWRLYILPVHFDYFDFVNHVRLDWQSNFTIEGPFEFLDISNSVLQNEQSLRAYLKRKRLGLVVLIPTLDYYPGSAYTHVLTRMEYKSLMQKAISELKAVDPAIKCLGCIETDYVAIDPAVLAQNIGFSSNNWSTLYQNLLSSILSPTRNPPVAPNSDSYFNSVAGETSTIDQANLPWKDSVWRDPHGNLQLFLGRANPPLTMLGIRVYPTGSAAGGNYQYQFLLENQIKFLLNEVGFDGFYIDDFSQSWNSPWTYFHTYTGWDGISADIDQSTGEIVTANGLYIDMGLAGRTARKEICEYALKNKKTVVANSYPASAPERSLPVNRFAETQTYFSGREDPFAIPLGQEPLLIRYFLRSSLASPIGLGIMPGRRVSFFGSNILVDHESVNDGETLTLVVGGHALAVTSGNFQGWNVSGGVSVEGSKPDTALTVSGNGCVSENTPPPPSPICPPPDDPSTTDTAQRLMRAVVDYLRHGMVYYHYALPEIPETGPGSGEYGPINHMFPLTPIALHKGWIEGKERIITAIHGTYVSVPPKANARPQVHCFDIWGRTITVPHKVSPLQTKLGPAWEVEVGIKDWAEIAVIEYGPDKTGP